MEVYCDLEVDVNGQQIFMVDKRILASFSGRLRNLFSKLNGSTRNLKVILHDFPGGAEGFELIARFCYSNGKIEITASNIVLLSSAAHFMEMGLGFDGDGKIDLKYQTEKRFEEINSWSWSELLLALKHCQDLIPTADNKFILEKVLVCMIERLAMPGVSSPYTPFSDDLFKLSCDTRSSDSIKNYSQRTWWFEDLLFLNVDLIDKVINMLVLQNFDHNIICKFLFYYRRSRFPGASQAEKCRITEVIINLLSLLDRSSLSFKGLFDIFRVASSLKLGNYYKIKLESLIGSQLDQATVDYLLVPSPPGKDYSYDVCLVLRLFKAFLFESSSWLSISRLNKVASLMDSYLTEVSPDPHLKPSKFAALLMVLPDSTRQFHDGFYQAIDMYLEVHAGLSEEEKMRVCRGLYYEKLSTEALKHLSLNSKFPSRLAVQSFINQRSKLKSFLPKTHHIATSNNPLDAKECIGEKGDPRKPLLYANKQTLSTETDKFEAELQGMQWRVVHMEKICKIMQTQMGNVTKPRLSSSGIHSRYLPKLCS